MQVLAGFGFGSSYKLLREPHLANPRAATAYPFVHLVHPIKIVHVLEVDIDLDYLLPGCSSGSEDISQVLDALLSVFGNSAFNELALLRKRDLNNPHKESSSFR